MQLLSRSTEVAVLKSLLNVLNHISGRSFLFLGEFVKFSEISYSQSPSMLSQGIVIDKGGAQTNIQNCVNFHE